MLRMGIVTKNGQRSFGGLRERVFAPMIAMGVRQRHGVDIIPTQAGRGQSPRQRARPDAQVDEQTELAAANDRGIAARSAGEDGQCGRTRAIHGVKEVQYFAGPFILTRMT